MHESTLTYYEVNARRFVRETRDVDLGHLRAPFLAWLPDSGARVLDAGCGSGRDSLAFLAEGHEVTAFDASGAMARLASEALGFPVLRMSFDEVEFEETFDGVWACASLLHVPRQDMAGVLRRLARALKSHGVLYTSFRYGDVETVRRGRLFSDYHEGSFEDVLQGTPELRPIELWRTPDARPERYDTAWLNVLLERVADR